MPIAKKFRNLRIRNLGSALCVVTLLTVLPGCQIFDRFRFHPEQNSPIIFESQPSKEELILHLKEQSERIQQLQSEVKLSVAGMPSLRGTLAVESPKRLRLTAGLLGVTDLGVDIGSNDEVFWFWTKVARPGEEPGIYFANHDQYRNSPLQTQIPIEPSWIIDSLGLLRFESQDRVEGPYQRPDERIELHTFRNVGSQPTVRKTVIDPKFGWIMQQSVYDASGRLIAYSDSIKHKHYPEENVSLPSQIRITAYDPDGNTLKMTVDTTRFRLNSIYGDPDKLWSMPRPGDVPMIDLVKGILQAENPSDRAEQINSQRIGDHRTSSNQNRFTESVFKNLR
ncbi:MAG: hypothetical protein AAGA30_15705 [Planctomycetota bacterium]